MIIKIDAREQELFAACKMLIEDISIFNEFTMESTNLPLGDVIINNGTNDIVIIERKTLADLSSSIKDGRYEEQSYRLNGIEHHNHNIIYLIEGNICVFNSQKSPEVKNKFLQYSAIVSLCLFKGFSVMRSQSIGESALILCNMAHKISQKFKQKKMLFYNNECSKNFIATTEQVDNNIDNHTNNIEQVDNNIDNILAEKQYCNVVKKIKKDNITINNIGEIMLCQIPGVSSTIAISILSHYKTLPMLIKAVQENNDCLNGMCIIDSNNKNRKISKNVIANIIKYLQ